MNRFLAFCFLLAGTALVHGSARPIPLPRSAPEAQGVSSAGVLAFVETADRQFDALNSFLLVRHGQVVAEGWWAPYAADLDHELYSLSKSFTATAIGLAIAEGRLSLDDEVLKFFPGDAPAEVAANLKAMRVRDLLCMSAGHQDETSAEPDRISPRSFLAHPVPHKPGTHFKYNTPATFMLSAIVQKQTGETLLEYLRPRLFEPLGIEHPTWTTNAQGISLGGYGLRVRTEDIAKFGQLHLQKGEWGGRPLLPAAWVAAATARQTSTGSNPQSDWDQGYGFQFWRSRHGAYRGDGLFGQFCVVLPEQDAVVALTAGVQDMQAVLNLVWDKLLPALGSAPLPEEPVRRAALEARLAGLSLRRPEGAATSPLAATVFGRKFLFPSNDQKLESLTILPEPGGAGWILSSRVNGVESRIPCGHREWKRSRARFRQYPDEPVAATGAWTTDDTFVARVCAVETPYCATVKLHFDGDRLIHDVEFNVARGPTRLPQLVGRAE